MPFWQMRWLPNILMIYFKARACNCHDFKLQNGEERACRQGKPVNWSCWAWDRPRSVPSHSVILATVEFLNMPNAWNCRAFPAKSCTCSWRWFRSTRKLHLLTKDPVCEVKMECDIVVVKRQCYSRNRKLQCHATPIQTGKRCALQHSLVVNV